ncbi:MAG: ABC transporter permease subunit [Vallitaleaceae bacterium]|jgi:peptide/nickel transport system permease protein|nr:ABC transporter permease subunit [Vallitaleaceae bacterium]
MIKRTISKMNPPMIIGMIIVMILLVLCLFGDFIAPRDPYEPITKTEMVDGTQLLIKPPYPPDGVNLLGTDILGRDILSRIIVGAKLTMAIVMISVFVKIVLSLLFGVLAGKGTQFFKSLIMISSTIGSGIPALVLTLMILRLVFVKYYPIGQSLLVFGLVIGLVEWGRVGKIVENQVEQIYEMPFMIGDKAVGKSSIRIIFSSVIPHLTTTLLIHTCLEIGRSLLMIAKLGVFEVYVAAAAMDSGMFGNKGLLGISFEPEYYPEWGALLGNARYAITSQRLWVIISTVIVMSTTILGFNMLGEGLKRFSWRD